MSLDKPVHQPSSPGVRTLKQPTFHLKGSMDAINVDDDQESQTMLKSNRDGHSQRPPTQPSKSAKTSLQTLLDALPCPIYYLNRAGTYLACNRAFLNQIICDASLKITGKSVTDLKDHVPAELIELCRGEGVELMENPGHQRYEARIRCNDGQTRNFRVQHSTLQDDGNRVVGIAGLMLDNTDTVSAETELAHYRGKLEEMDYQPSKTLMDINAQLSKEIEERRKAEKALQNSEERYRSIFENNGTATILIESDMTISMANAKFEKLAGLSRDEFVGRTKILDLVAPQDRDRIKLYHELRMKGDTNAPRQYEFQAMDGDGGVLDVLANVQWLPDTRQTVASLLDITEKNQL